MIGSKIMCNDVSVFLAVLCRPQYLLSSLFEFGEDVDMGIIEIGANKPGEIESICQIVQPDMGIITNVYEAHIEFFGTIDSVAETKSALFSSLPKSGTAFVNMDDKILHSTGLQGRKNILKKFDVEKMCNSTFTEYKKLLQ